MRRRIESPVLRAAALFLFVCLPLLGLPGRSRAQSNPAPPPLRPEYRWIFDVPVLTAGAALLIASSTLDAKRRFVPDEGIDPDDIRWSLDRRMIGERSTKADGDSDYFCDIAAAYPMMLAMLCQPAGSRINGTFWRSLEYAESILITGSLSWFIKESAGRPRPYAYLPGSERPNNAAYDVTTAEAFRSMPSEHATIAFCAANFSLTDHLISRPAASWQERAAVGFIGGFLAGTTAGLRVEGGQHFPSDTIVGGLIGTVGGVAIPLFHHYIGADGQRSGWPSARAWWQALAGEIAGIGAGVLLAETY
jgi:membrane-associated phospholipid phosphatase